MKITKEQPPAVYVLKLTQAELSALYYLLHDRYCAALGLGGAPDTEATLVTSGLDGVNNELYRALREYR